MENLVGWVQKLVPRRNSGATNKVVGATVVCTLKVSGGDLEAPKDVEMSQTTIIVYKAYKGGWAALDPLAA